MKSSQPFLLLLVLAGLVLFAPSSRAQAPAGAGSGAMSAFVGDAPSPKTSTTQLNVTYRQPTEKTKFRNYIYDTFGPVPVAEAFLVAAGNQYEHTPPEWGQGFNAYMQRVGSNFGMGAVTTTTRYLMAEAFREDTIYYRCECAGFLRRFKHAMIATVAARHGEDGHWLFSFSAVGASYAGSMATVYGWYPSRYGAKDGLRMGTYNFLGYAGQNLFLEFIYGGPRTLFGHLRRQNYSESDPTPTYPPPTSTH